MGFFGGTAVGFSSAARQSFWGVLVAAGVAAVIGTAVTSSSSCAPGPFTCTNAADCANGTGVQGVCETGFCAYPDSTCPATNERYSASAGNGLASVCVPVPSASSACVKHIAVGQDSSCYLLTNGTVWCWGNNSNGTIGVDPTSSAMCPGNQKRGPAPCVATPTEVQGLPDSSNPIIAIKVAESHACAQAQDGTVYCWGSNDRTNLGQCKSPTELVQSFTPLEVFYASVKLSDSADGGASAAGQTAVWSCDESSPLKVLPPDTNGNGTTMTVGGEHTCVIDVNHKILCWGENTTAPVGGQAGQDFNTLPSVEGPLEVLGSTTTMLNQQSIVSVQAGDAFTCLLTGAQRVFCWGGNQDGELGTNGNPNTTCTSNGTAPVGGCTWSASPSIIETASGVDALAMDDATACTLSQGSNVVCWGSGGTGIFQAHGLSNEDNPLTLATIGVQLFGGPTAETYCAEDKNEVVTCWGANNLGQCASPFGGDSGTGSTMITTPTTALIASVAEMQIGADHGCALTRTGELYCWGDNSYGELGQGNPSTTPSYIPQPIAVACPGEPRAEAGATGD
jgi:alpha-tubulin suppressor-like RCC1 family protein